MPILCNFTIKIFLLRIYLRIIDKMRVTYTSSACRKSMIFQKKCLSSIPIPKPLSPERGYITGATAPRPCWGLRPKQGCFGCLPKVLHDAKPAEQATLNTHFLITIEFFDRLMRVTYTSRFYLKRFENVVLVLDFG